MLNPDNIKTIATLSDKNYLLNGLALYESLCKYCVSFVLHYLCVDDYTYKFFQKNKIRNINPIHINELQSKEFDCLVQNHESHPIDSSDGQSPFHWALAPMFIHHVLQTAQECLYVDSDIVFYNKVDDIFNSVINYDVGLITHKHCRLEKNRRNVGYYNVGIIYFKNSTFGSACCRWWRDVVVDTSNPWFNPYGSCGDQKYLEIFEDIFPLLKIKIIDEDIGHSAPWNMGPSTLENGFYTWPSDLVLKGTIYTKQPLYFHHFSHFTPNYANNTWSHQRNNEWGNCVDTEEKKKLYQNYYNQLVTMKEKYGI